MYILQIQTNMIYIYIYIRTHVYNIIELLNHALYWPDEAAGAQADQGIIISTTTVIIIVTTSTTTTTTVIIIIIIVNYYYYYYYD